MSWWAGVVLPRPPPSVRPAQSDCRLAGSAAAAAAADNTQSVAETALRDSTLQTTPPTPVTRPVWRNTTTINQTPGLTRRDQSQLRAWLVSSLLIAALKIDNSELTWLPSVHRGWNSRKRFLTWRRNSWWVKKIYINAKESLPSSVLCGGGGKGGRCSAGCISPVLSCQLSSAF